jgi:LDH2 family malate/lactate/ureidoglycolate dehydrogenase
VDTLIRDLRNSARLPDVKRIWLPGEQSAMKRARYQAEGIPLSDGVVRDLDSLADQLGIARLKTVNAMAEHAA